MMQTIEKPTAELSAVVRTTVKALRRVAEFRMPAVLDRQMLDLGERKEFLNPTEHAQLMELVAFSEERLIDKLQAELALRQLKSMFPTEI